MVIVDGMESIKVQMQVQKNLDKMPNADEITEYLCSKNEGVLIMPDTEFTYASGHKRKGFYMDATLKSNLDNFLIPAVNNRWDGVGLITGMEGSAKSTNAMSIAKYLDPTFPGEPLGDGTSHRSTDRIVFTPRQFMEAIDAAKPKQAIVFDEAVMGFLAGDASTEIQKSLVKKMVTIRKKQLYIFIVLPSIFLLRMYMAMFRTRFLIHFYTPDGISRGYFKFYSYESKRKLFVKGKKDFNQDAVSFDFGGRATDTGGLFFDINEYENKKDVAITAITEEPEEKKKELKFNQYKIKGQRDLMLQTFFKFLQENNPGIAVDNYVDILKQMHGEHMAFSKITIYKCFEDARIFKENPLREETRGAKKDEFIEKLKKKLN